MDREQLPPDIRAAVELLAMELPEIVNNLGKSLAGLRHELDGLARHVEALEADNEVLRSSVDVVRQRLGLS